MSACGHVAPATRKLHAAVCPLLPQWSAASITAPNLRLVVCSPSEQKHPVSAAGPPAKRGLLAPIQQPLGDRLWAKARGNFDPHHFALVLSPAAIVAAAVIRVPRQIVNDPNKAVPRQFVTTLS